MTAAQATKSATVTAVNMARAELRLLGVNVPAGAVVADAAVSIKLTNSTTVWATRLGSATSVDIEFELTEW